MNFRDFYEESWRRQRERETSHPMAGLLSRIRQRLSVSRVEAAVGLLLALTPRGGALLDVGFGRGELLKSVAAHFDRLVGIDLAETEMDYFRRSLSDDVSTKIELHATDLNDAWPLSDASFDAVSCLAVLEHLIDPHFVARELTRVLRPSGLLVVEVPNIAYLKYRLLLLSGVFPDTSGDPVGWDGGHLHYFTVVSLSNLFALYGCKVRAVSGAGFLGRLRSRWPALLTSDIIVVFEKA